MEDLRRSSANMSQDSDDQEYSHLVRNESENIVKLRAENFHLRLRCHNLENELGECNCTRAKVDNNDMKKEFYEQRDELNRLIQSQQELIWNNEQLSNKNTLLKERCELFEGVEQKLNEYESLKMKYNQLNLIVKSSGSMTEAVVKIMSDNDCLIKSNTVYLQKIQHLESKLSNKNISYLEEECQRRKSVTHSLNKMFKDANESSFQNTSHGMSIACMKCDELKVYIDKLTESAVKMTVDHQSVAKLSESKDREIVRLEKRIASMECQPKVKEEEEKRYKTYFKQTARKYDKLVIANEKQVKDYETTISWYIKEQGDQQRKIEALENKEKTNTNSRVVEMEELFVKKLSEVSNANEQISSLMKSINLSQGNINEYDQVGQYSPQYKIHAGSAGTSSIDCDTDSVYYGNNLSLNATAFNMSLEKSLIHESNINTLMDNMQHKVQELGEVVQSYLHIVKNDLASSKRDIGTSIMSLGSPEKENNETSRRTDNDDIEYSVNEDRLLKKAYEKEKQQYEYRLEMQLERIDNLTDAVTTMKQENSDAECGYRLRIKNLTSDYKTKFADLQSNILDCNVHIEKLEETIADKNRTISELKSEGEKSRDKLTKKIEVLKERSNEMTTTIKDLNEIKNSLDQSLLAVNESFGIKIGEMEQVFRKVKAIIEGAPQLFPENAIDVKADSIRLDYLWHMLNMVEHCLDAVKNTSPNSSLCSQSWKATAEMSAVTDRAEQAADTSIDHRARHTPNISLQSDHHFLDLTNVTDMNEELIPVIDMEPIVDTDDTEKKVKYIRENPEKIQKRLKYYYDTCLMLKGIVLKRHEENKRMKSNFDASYKTLNDMTRQIVEFKKQLELCKQCLTKSQATLPDSLVQELLRLNLL